VYSRPGTVEEAATLLATAEALVVCGGTDVYPAHTGRPVSRPVVDLSAIAELRGITRTEGVYRIGGTTTWSSIVRAQLPPAFDALKAAAREVGSIQIQNRGTIAGNLCNASPAADGVPPLLVLDASVELTSVRGVRTLPLQSFITGYRQTAVEPGEILTAVLVPDPGNAAQTSFLKLGARRYLVISIVMVAALVERDAKGAIARAAVAVGAASPVACRLKKLEAALRGLRADVVPSSLVRPDHLSELSPIDDVRATAAYRSEAAATLVGEALDRAAGRAGSA